MLTTKGVYPCMSNFWHSKLVGKFLSYKCKARYNKKDCEYSIFFHSLPPNKSSKLIPKKSIASSFLSPVRKRSKICHLQASPPTLYRPRTACTDREQPSLPGSIYFRRKGASCRRRWTGIN